MSINEYVDKFIQNHRLLSINAKVLVAVSGGLDSMVLLSSVHKTGIKIGVATVHYDLRPESIDEAELVKDYCQDNDITFHLRQLDKAEKENLKTSNLQQKARDIRYEFFDMLIDKHQYTHIMTAHHMDDQIEGLFLGLSRGAGLNGLSGMNEVKGRMLRPLLSLRKKDLETYAEKNGVKYLHDSSNFTNDYDRNYFRNEVLPLIESRFNNFAQTTHNSILHLSDTQQLLSHLLQEKSKQYIRHTKNELRIGPLTEINNTPGAITLLHLLVKDTGFTTSQITDIQRVKSSGAYFISDTHEAIVSNNELIIRELQHEVFRDLKIEGPGSYSINKNTKLVVSEVSEAKYEKSTAIEYFDMDAFSFPITMRPWANGDKFQPIGMNGKSKKVQDLLTDAKLNRFQKEDVKVLAYDEKLLWVMNFRMDERFKISKGTQRILKMSIVFGK